MTRPLERSGSQPKHDTSGVLRWRVARLHLAWMLAGTLWLTASVAHAQDAAPVEGTDDDGAPLDGDLESLLQERVVATASRQSESAATAPAAVYSIGRSDIERYGIRTLDEALSFLGLGVFVSNPGWDYVSGLDVGVHGVLFRDGNSHVLLLVDGHIMNHQGSGAALVGMEFGVPLNAIDHIEVMLGPGSVGYGSNAMLAVLNVVTRRGSDVQGLELVADGNLLAPTDAEYQLTGPSGGDGFGARSRIDASYGRRFRVGSHEGDFAIHVGFQQELSATYRVEPQTGDYVEVRPDESAWGLTPARHRGVAPSFLASLRYGGFSAQLVGSFYRRDVPFSGTWDEPNSFDQEGSVRFDLAYDADPSARTHVRARLYGDYVGGMGQDNWINPWWCLPGMDDGCLARSDLHSISAGAEVTSAMDWKLDDRYPTLIGADLRFRDTRSHISDFIDRETGQLGDGVTQRPYFDVTSFLGAVFVQQVLRPVDLVTISLGARLDVDSLFGARVSPRASVMLAPREGTGLRVSYSEAFRGPTALELNSTDLVWLLPPDSLDAEVVRFADVEWMERFERARLSVRGFGSYNTNLVDDREVDPAVAQQAIDDGRLAASADPELVITPANLGKLAVVGGTLSLRVDPTPRLELATGLTGSVSYERSEGSFTRVDPIMPYFFGNARVAYRFDRGNTTVALATRFSSDRTAITLPGNGADVSRSAGPLLDLRLSVTGDLGVATGLSYRVGALYSVNSRSTNLLSPGPDPLDPEQPDFAASESAVFAPLPMFALYVGLRYRLPSTAR